MSEAANHVLLIEDNPGDADLVRLRLVESEARADVSCVSRLSDGLASLEAHPPSVVLLDLNLPDSQGADTFRKVLDKAPDVPVVILSGQNDEALAIKALHQGVQDYLVKDNITSRTLDRAMRYAIERQGLLRSLEMSRKQQLEFKNQFLSHVSHELRTPLTCIHQYVTLLLDGLAGEVTNQQREHLRTVLKSVRQLSAMVRDLLEATRAETGKISLEWHCVSIGELMRQAVAMMQPLAREKQVGLEIGLDTRIPFVHGDPDRILEVLINLVDNGIKFTPAGGAVTVQACLVPADPGLVYVSVMDTGRGISPEAKPLIFERLYQDPQAVDNSRKGLGLGLFIARELVRLHGGRIWVASESGHGTTFSFTLPLYTLAKLLLPVITKDAALREAIVLVRVDLKSRNNPVRANWREICRRLLERLQRCVYVDKDVVLPPMPATGQTQSFFVVASTDLTRVEIMLARIREQLANIPDLHAAGELQVSASGVSLPDPAVTSSLEEQVKEVADRVTGMMQAALTSRQDSEITRDNARA